MTDPTTNRAAAAAHRSRRCTGWRRRRAASLGLLCALLAGCSSGGSTAAGSSAPTASPTMSPLAPTPLATPGSHAATGTSFTLRLPDQPAYRGTAHKTTAKGSVEQMWQVALRPDGPACTVLSVEQPNFTQKFPESVQAVFTAMNADQDDHVLRNDATTALTGTAGTVDQELTFTGRLAKGGGKFPAHLFQRQFLTPGKTLVSLTTVAPEADVVTCRAKEILASLAPTGRELSTASPSTA